jgi:hypothetical protein
MADERIQVLYCHDKAIGMWFISEIGKGPLQPEQLKIMREFVEAKFNWTAVQSATSEWKAR